MMGIRMTNSEVALVVRYQPPCRSVARRCRPGSTAKVRGAVGNRGRGQKCLLAWESCLIPGPASARIDDGVRRDKRVGVQHVIAGGVIHVTIGLRAFQPEAHRDPDEADGPDRPSPEHGPSTVLAAQ